MKNLIQLIQNGIPLDTSEPFKKIAEKLNSTEVEVINEIKKLKMKLRIQNIYLQKLDNRIKNIEYNRYSFFYDTDWQNKITELKINSEVDFIVKDNKATEIYCLNNKNNDDISLNKNNIPFKKMDFDSIEKNGNDLSFVKDFRIRMFKYLSVSVVILVLGLFLIDKGLVYNWILYIISFISYKLFETYFINLKDKYSY